MLKKAGLTREVIAAQTLAVNLDAYERIDRMIMQTEARRAVIWREVDRHRDIVATRRLRELAAEIDEAGFEEANSDVAEP